MTPTDFASALYTALQNHHFQIKGHINFNSDKIQRFQDAKKPKGKDLFVVLHEQRGATFGDWHDRDEWVTWWHSERKSLSIQEDLQYRAQRKELEKQREIKRFRACQRAQHFWQNHITNSSVYEHPYVIKKRISPYYSKIVNQRWIRDALIIPIRDIDYQLITIQLIKANGFKRIWKGTSQKDLMMWLSLPLPSNYNGTIRICEGYATGCSIYEAIGSPVICAINANNIVSVTQQLKNKYPLATLVICADNDAWSKDNPGIQYATDAMLLTGAIMRRPAFTHLDTSKKPTDFNDLLCLAGIEEVEKQLLMQHK